MKTRHLTITAYGIATLITSMLAAAPSAFAAERPNIILIMADDMGFECVAANGGETYETPHIDKLAATGMRFEHCYSQPICTPSRVQIMTGRYNSANYIQFGLLDPKATTFGNVLQDAGYATCIVGKWQLKGGFEGPNQFGFDEYCLWQLTRRPNRYPNPGVEVNGKEVDYKNGEYGPDIVSDYACDFIERKAKGDKPFLVYYPMMLPHWPFEPTPDSPEWDPRVRVNDKSEKGNGTNTTQFFDDMVHYVDKIIGKLVAKLEAEGVRDDTLILFTGDNGTYTGITSRFKGRDWKGGKSHMMDNGTHVTFIANWNGHVPAGRVNNDLVDFSDVLPTLAEAASAKVPVKLGVTGRSILPQLMGKPGTPREHVYCWYFRNGKLAKGGTEHAAGESARDHRYKLYLNGGLYDVPRDFYETSPLDPNKLTDEQKTIRDRLDTVIQKYTREGFYEEPSTAPKNKKSKARN